MARTKQTARKGIPSKQIRQKPSQTTSTKSTPKKKKVAKKGITKPSGIKRPHRFRPGTVANREIKKYRESTELLIKRLPFMRYEFYLYQFFSFFLYSYFNSILNIIFF